MRFFIPDRFSVLRVLREDRYSRTFIAADHVQERSEVVVRIIRKPSFNRTQIEQFSWFAGIRHKNLSVILDTGVTRNGDFYYVREYFPTSELFSIDSLNAVKALVYAVDFLHSHRRVHGAIKPSNVFVNGACLKLTDPNFNADQAGFDEDIRFSAPEVLRNESRTLESDLYSLGAVLYRLLTRRNLFEDINLVNLRAKYTWAAPLPIGNLCDVPKTISDAVFQLLAKAPQARLSAFDSLKQRLGSESEAAGCAPFVGRDDLLNEMLAKLRQHQNNGLRVFLVEGPPGMGKSRLVEELRTRSSLDGLVFLKSSCVPNSDELYAMKQLIRGLHRNLDYGQNSKRSLRASSNIEPDFSSSSIEAKRASLIEELISDFLTTVSRSSRPSPVVIAIEDVDKADSATVELLQRLAIRAVKARVTLILTQRGGQAGSKLRTMLADYFPGHFHYMRIPPLSEAESVKLIRFFGARPERQPSLLRMSRGNPALIEHYSTVERTVSRSEPPIELQALVSQIPQEAQALARTLSVFAGPIELEIAAQLLDLRVHNLGTQIQILEDLGVIIRSGTMLEIAYPAVGPLIYRTISRANKVRLAKTRLELVCSDDSDIEHLANCLFEAKMFREAGILYQQLAKALFTRQNFRKAETSYELQQRCVRLSRSEPDPYDALELVKCYQWSGKALKGRLLCERLFSKEAVRNNPELLSEIYVRLANARAKASAEERVRRARLALECLPPNSPKICFRYLTLASRLMEIGDLSGARQILEITETHAVTDEDVAFLEASKGALFINIGDFRSATQCFLRVDQRHVIRVGILNNLALSFENLGDLKTALEYQSQTQSLAVAAGLRHVQILSLSNLGSIRTKLGDTVEAERLLTGAFASADECRKTDDTFDMTRLLTVYCDTALHSAQIGRYRRAAECLKRIEPTAGAVYEIDRVYYRIVQCLVYSAIGLHNKVQWLLTQLRNSETFKQPFFQVENALIAVNMAIVWKDEVLSRLQSALITTRELGTLHQQCRVLNELAAILASDSRSSEAEEYAKTALELAEQQGYKPLAARAQLLLGIAGTDSTEKVRNLIAAFQNASEMGLPELAAESACHLGIHYLDAGNLVTARDYLFRSVSTTDGLAGEIPVRLRRKYLAKPWRRQAREALERCNVAMQQQGIYADTTLYGVPGDDRYFKATYRLALAAAAVKSTDALLSLIEETLRTTSERPAVITLKEASQTFVRGIRIKVSPEVTQRILDVARMAKNRMYFGCPDMARPKETVAWIPLRSETREGGIYVVCRQNEAPLTEKEMELLAIIGTIANGALRELETNHDGEFDNAQLAEFHGMIGASKEIRDVYAQIEIAARNTATVLIEGESGTGKELVAKAIHAAGPRAKGPFIAVDCGAIPEALIETELFGAKKGSYTGAIMDRPGLFEAANRGTIFLDEISNTTPALQAKLLRVIQEREVRRIGETRDRPIDVRLIVASNANLETLAREGRFRKDLLYRLKVLYFKMPTLRSRRDDIPMLAHAFLQKLNAANKLKKYFGPGVLNHLSTQTFPGNVRELQNAIERAFFSAKGGAITDIPLENQLQSPSDADEVMSWFKELSEGRTDFWSAIHNRYKRRDISREKILALVDLGLRSTRGSYKNLASTFHLKERDYRRFMDFLRRNECLLDFRPYRKGADDAQ